MPRASESRDGRERARRQDAEGGPTPGTAYPPNDLAKQSRPGFCESLDEITVLISRREIELPFKYVSMLLIKCRCLETVTGNQYYFAIATSCFLFGRLQQSPPITLSTQRRVNPEGFNFTSVSPSPAR